MRQSYKKMLAFKYEFSLIHFIKSIVWRGVVNLGHRPIQLAFILSRTFEGTMRVLWSSCDISYHAYSSCRVPSKALRLAVATGSGTILNATYERSQEESGCEFNSAVNCILRFLLRCQPALFQRGLPIFANIFVHFNTQIWQPPYFWRVLRAVNMEIFALHYYSRFLRTKKLGQIYQHVKIILIYCYQICSARKLQPTQCHNGSIVRTFTHAKVSTFTVIWKTSLMFESSLFSGC